MLIRRVRQFSENIQNATNLGRGGGENILEGGDDGPGNGGPAAGGDFRRKHPHGENAKGAGGGGAERAVVYAGLLPSASMWDKVWKP